jgi:hypothetical protein
MDMSHL